MRVIDKTPGWVFYVSIGQSSYQEWCRYPAGALSSVRSGAGISPLGLFNTERVTMNEPVLFNFTIRNQSH